MTAHIQNFTPALLSNLAKMPSLSVVRNATKTFTTIGRNLITARLTAYLISHSIAHPLQARNSTVLKTGTSPKKIKNLTSLPIIKNIALAWLSVLIPLSSTSSPQVVAGGRHPVLRGTPTKKNGSMSLMATSVPKQTGGTGRGAA